MRRDYQRLDILEFGHHLLETGDLDPVYIALQSLEDHRQLCRWLIAYWCLYHCGAASYLSEREGTDFFSGLWDAASNKSPAPTGGRWPRGHERRHFRGDQAERAMTYMTGRWGNMPESMVTYIMEGAPDYQSVASRVQEHVLFGPWISFKVADMIDRVMGEQVDFSEAAVFMFRDPVQSALRLWREHFNLPETARPRDQGAVIHQVVEYLTEYFHGHPAPPLYDRDVGLQEVETILCKWKSHMNGHYPLFNDIREIREGLQPWLELSSTARVFEQAMPREER